MIFTPEEELRCQVYTIHRFLGQASVVRERKFMARRDESILNLLVKCPWWVSVLVSGIAFVGLRFVLPSIDFGGVAANSFAKV